MIERQADQQQQSHDRAGPEIRLGCIQRPFLRQGHQVEISTGNQQEADPLKRHKAQCAPPSGGCWPEGMAWQARKIANRSHDSSSLAPLGQNHAVNTAPVGSAPQTTAQGVKMEASRTRLITKAEISGQIEGGMED